MQNQLVKNQLARDLSIRQLVAYFNILRTPCLGGRDAKSILHLRLVRELLNEAGLAKAVKQAEKKGRSLVAV